MACTCLCAHCERKEQAHVTVRILVHVGCVACDSDRDLSATLPTLGLVLLSLIHI